MTGNSLNMAGNSNDPLTTLFVGDLSIFCTENDLLMLFSNFGAMPKVQVKRGKQGEALQYGFVVLPRSVAIEAAERVNGIKFLGRRLRIKLKLAHDAPSIIVQERNRSCWAQIHFSFITHQVTHAIGEEMLDRVFSSIGAVADVAIKQHSITIDPPRQTAYGFIFFYEVEAAQRAIQEMKHVQIDGVMFDCNWSNQRDADSDARRKLLARQQKPIISPASLYQTSPQYTPPGRNSYASSPDMTGLGYDLSMAMEGLTMGPAGLTLSQPMTNPMNSMSGMYGPPPPHHHQPSPIGLGMPNMMSNMSMNYHQQPVAAPSHHQYHQQMSQQQHHMSQGQGSIYTIGSSSPQGATSMGFFPPPSQMSSGSTDSFTSYTPSSMSMMPEAGHMSSMDGSILQQRGMYMVAPPPLQHPQLPRYQHHHTIPHPMSMNRVTGGGGGRGYIPGGIASSATYAAAAPQAPIGGSSGGGYCISGGVAATSSGTLPTSPPRPPSLLDSSEQH